MQINLRLAEIFLKANALTMVKVSLPEQRSSYGHHRCVTPLYRIPMWSFHCMIN